MSCRALESSAPGDAPFSRHFVFDWYDGPVSGLVECGAGEPVFAFRMVAWDNHQEQRVYVLQPVSAGAFDEAARADGEEDAFERFQEILRAAGPIEYVVLAENEIPGSLRSVHRVGEGAVRERIEAMMVAVGLDEDFVASEHTHDEWTALLRTIA